MADCATWWFDHVGQTYLYVVAVRQGDEKEQAEEVEKLVDGAEEWGKLLGLPEAGQLMTEHVALVKALVDAAFAGNQEVVDQAVDGLLSNVEQQTALYSDRIPGFPADEWNLLFAKHVSATGAYVLAMAAGDAEDFKKNLGVVVLDRNALARLWTRVCARRPQGK